MVINRIVRQKDLLFISPSYWNNGRAKPALKRKAISGNRPGECTPRPLPIRRKEIARPGGQHPFGAEQAIAFPAQGMQEDGNAIEG